LYKKKRQVSHHHQVSKVGFTGGFDCSSNRSYFIDFISFYLFFNVWARANARFDAYIGGMK
jgi:hypothetical protein